MPPAGNRNFPGIIELSAVGFSKDKTKAVVYMARNCSPICSGGDLMVLQKHADVWKPGRTTCWWKS